MATDEPQTLPSLAATQLGLFTCEQADGFDVGEGVRRTMLSKGLIRRIHKNVYVFAGHELSPAGVHLASVLAGGHSARSSHRAAAWLWGLTPYEQKPEITTTERRVRIQGVRVHQTRSELRDPQIRRGVPATSAAETLLDIGGVLPLELVQAGLDRGIATRVVTPMSALAELDRRGRSGVRGTAALRALLVEAGITGSHPPSVLEAKTRRLIAKAGLPQPECELIVGEHGQYRLDFCWPELMLAIEVDGWMYHSSEAAFRRNKSRKNSLTISGYLILEYSWFHVTKTPGEVVREVKAAFEARSRLFV